MNYCAHGDLGRFIKEKSDSINEKVIAGIIFQALKALGHIHNQGFVHRDIKAENILISSLEDQMVIKLCDFGFCAKFSDS